MAFSEGFNEILAISFPGQQGTIRDTIAWYVKDFAKNKKCIMQGKVPASPVKLAIGFICGRSGRWAAVTNKADDLLKNVKPFDLLKEGRLHSFMNGVYKQRSGRGYKQSRKKIVGFLKAVKDLQGELGQWPKNEQLNRFKEQFREIMEKQAGIGIKGQNNLLRDCGFYEHIPIDVHERRFLLRTGIFHKYASLDKSDPEDDEDLAKALSHFCKTELNTLQVEGVLLSDAPGLVDLIIWYFSQEKTEQQNRLGICAKDPQCDRCPLKPTCLFAQMHSI